MKSYWGWNRCPSAPQSTKFRHGRPVLLEEERFTRVWQEAGGTAENASQVYAELCSRYGAPGRHYHTPRHICQCLRQLDEARSRIPRPDYVEIALWFHDVIYDAKAKDNEDRSARLFLTLATDLPCTARQAISSLIMATVHPSEPTSTDQQFIVDIDLSSFGLPWEEFLRDSRDVRAEFPHLTNDLFLNGQGSFLRCLMARKNFYLTPFFRERLEARARQNIKRYLGIMEVDTAVH